MKRRPIQKHLSHATSRRPFKRLSHTADYKQFMRSPRWRQIRAAKLDSVKGVCEDCKNAQATEVHHENYTRFGGDEFLSDLRALCRDCHGLIQKTSKEHGGMWFSTRVAAQHALTQFGVDIRDRLIASYGA